MSVIEVCTYINAPQHICFQLALSVDLHTISTQQTQEQIVGGICSGVLQLGDSVTFRARHFGIWQKLTSKITELNAPSYFCDVMQQGAFKQMRHEHHYAAKGAQTLMRDVFAFESPLGWLGKLVDRIVLKRYLRHFLKERGQVAKQYAESGRWRGVLISDWRDTGDEFN
ncbi:SRPBCC family protein [Hymenobacter sp.]|jgi:ligand-binding SRPBCC domain-containing protein|uniref:SRPBCC family protein n=1 Tax=Hymenobacter sp. TaxID=1898978 RepID=UPI002ED9183A